MRDHYLPVLKEQVRREVQQEVAWAMTRTRCTYCGETRIRCPHCGAPEAGKHTPPKEYARDQINQRTWIGGQWISDAALRDIQRGK